MAKRVSLQTSKRASVWTNESLQLLGTMSDEEVARRLKLTDSAVNMKRRSLGIPSFGKSTEANKHAWSKKELEMLGVLSDAQVARTVGLSAGAVATKRRSLGLPLAGGKPSRRRRWTKKEIALLGKITDVAYSKQSGIGRRHVREKRNELGIPAFQSNHTIKPWSAAMLRDLPKLSIQEFVKKYSITRTRVIAKRLLIGLLPTESKSRSRWTPEMDRELMESKVKEFAVKYGISPQAAYNRRAKIIANSTAELP